MREEIARIVRGFAGTMGVCAAGLDGDELVAIAADEVFPAASLIKVAVMVEVFHRIAAGDLARESTVTLRADDRAGDEPGPLDHVANGASLTVGEVLAAMIAHSDNTATNLLLGLVGTEAVNRRMAAHGLPSTRIFRPPFRDGRADVEPDAECEYGLGATTPREMARLFAAMARGEMVDAASSAAMLALLRDQRDRAMIPRELPLAEGRIRVANKTGWDREKQPDPGGFLGEVRTDAAYVEAPGLRYVIAICARRVRDASPGADNEALRAGARISRLVYQHLRAR